MDIALVQQYVSESSMETSQQSLRAIKDAAEAGARLVIFPELSFTPYLPQIDPVDREDLVDVLDLAETVPGPTTESMQEAAEEYDVAIVANVFERAGDTGYCTSFIVDHDGSLVGASRMMHVPQYSDAYARDYYAPGDSGTPVFETSVGTVGLATSYDFHFPEYMRGLAEHGAEIVAVPQSRAGKRWARGVPAAEVKTAAFQQGYFVAGANRLGREDRLFFDGGSVVADPLGRVVAKAPQGEAIILMASLDKELLQDAPAKRFFLPDRKTEAYEQGAVRSTASVDVSV
ncbi:carbon-nitrogen hydrolase family protein [Salisaeta longa]|uniref:carbon-nitrogen hydrolase family protein n=1 Tax=Salisaeta longa TaxID=503170 RepID=UPI0003B61D7D|nr:carbon-nitrogen hydrolase family protein [Salisaeta longa]